MIGEFLLTQKSKSANQYKHIGTSVGKQFRSHAEGQKVDWLDSLSIVGFFNWRREEGRHGKKQVTTLFIVNRLKYCSSFVGVRTGNICGKFPPLRSRVARISAVLPLIRDFWNKVIQQSRNWINEHTDPSIKQDRTLFWNYV